MANTRTIRKAFLVGATDQTALDRTKASISLPHRMQQVAVITGTARTGKMTTPLEIIHGTVRHINGEAPNATTLGKDRSIAPTGVTPQSTGQRWEVQAYLRLSTLLKKKIAASITVLEPPSDSRQLQDWATKIESQNTNNNFVVLVSSRLRDSSEESLFRLRRELLWPFSRPERVEISAGWEAVPTVLEEVIAKWEVLNEKKAGNPLDKIESVVRATRDLRVENGKISADKVASLFGISVSELASWIGRTRQALSKTPDAESIQPILEDFERIARLRTIVSDDDFRKWLRSPIPALDGAKPLDLLANKNWREVAELVEDVLTGAPA